jgi:hypothetical protein
VPPHEIQPGECISTLAMQHGIDPQTIWSAPGNAELRGQRPDPNVLAAGDRVDVPARSPKRVSVEANRRHVLQLSHTHVALRVRLETAAGPLRNTPWVLEVGGRDLEGTTDGDGLLEARIPATVTAARVRLPERNEELRLELGHLDPCDGWRGAAQRLANLGYLAGAIAIESSPALRLALVAFQRDAKLDETGELDPPTIDALRERHGS